MFARRPADRAGFSTPVFFVVGRAISPGSGVLQILMLNRSLAGRILAVSHLNHNLRPRKDRCPCLIAGIDLFPFENVPRCPRCHHQEPAGPSVKVTIQDRVSPTSLE